MLGWKPINTLVDSPGSPVEGYIGSEARAITFF